MNYQDLEKMTVVKLREEASKLEDVKGVSGMKKEELIHLLCEKLHDHQTLAEIRRRIRVYKRSLRKHTVKSA
jgi:RAB protein geranylgeranyltransferase component A